MDLSRAYVYDSDGNFLWILQIPEPEENAEFSCTVSIARDAIVVREYKVEVGVLNERASALSPTHSPITRARRFKMKSVIKRRVISQEGEDEINMSNEYNEGTDT